MEEKQLKKSDAIKLLRESIDKYEDSKDEVGAIGLLMRQAISLIHAEGKSDNPHEIFGKACHSLYVEMDLFVKDFLKAMNAIEGEDNGDE